MRYYNSSKVSAMATKKKEKHAGGRPSKYDQSFNIQAYKLCLLGATDKELSDFFEVSEDTVNEWKKRHPQFSVSIKKGKDQADAVVAEKLFKRATGYVCPDVDIKVIDKRIVVTDLKKHYPPDTLAGIFWLKNRQKEKWRDRTDITTNGKELPAAPMPIMFIPADRLTDAQLEQYLNKNAGISNEGIPEST